jgi:uncharacterized protein
VNNQVKIVGWLAQQKIIDPSFPYDQGGKKIVVPSFYAQGLLEEGALNDFMLIMLIGAKIIDINTPIAGKTFLYNFVVKKDASKVAWLLDHGADPNSADAKGETPLFVAVEAKNKPIVDALLKAGAEVEPFVAMNDQAKVAYLLDNGANFNMHNKNGKTPLIIAVEAKNQPMIKLLLSKGVDANIAEADGVTPVHLATILKDADIIKMFLDAGADIHKEDVGGKSALDVIRNFDAKKNDPVENKIKKMLKDEDKKHPKPSVVIAELVQFAQSLQELSAKLNS